MTKPLSGRFTVTYVQEVSQGIYSIAGDFADESGLYGPSEISLGDRVYLYDNNAGAIKYNIIGLDNVSTNPITLTVEWDSAGDPIEPPGSVGVIVAVTANLLLPEQPSFTQQSIEELLSAGIIAETYRDRFDSLTIGDGSGTPGPTGAQGATGAQGEPGATGAQGPTGAQGEPGATGAQGEPGATGAQGEPGPTGAASFYDTGYGLLVTQSSPPSPGSSGSLQVDTSIIATKEYVDSTALGLDVKQSVDLATTEPVSLYGKIAIVDGVSLHAGLRVLVKNQLDDSENGIWVVSADAWTRASDADTVGVSGENAKLNPGAFVFVEEGGQAGTGWVANVHSVGATREVTWSQFSSVGAGATGAQGATGEQGIQGPTGPQGATGAQGEPGATGAQGEPGATGAQGEPGATGATPDTSYFATLVSGVVPDEQLPIDLVRADDLGTSLGEYVPLSQKGATGGVAELDITGKVPLSQIPDGIASTPEIVEVQVAVSASDILNVATISLVPGTGATFTFIDDYDYPTLDGWMFQGEGASFINLRVLVTEPVVLAGVQIPSGVYYVSTQGLPSNKGPGQHAVFSQYTNYSASHIVVVKDRTNAGKAYTQPYTSYNYVPIGANGAQGPTGAQGPQGATGAQGNFGGITLEYIYDELSPASTMVDAGKVYFDPVTQSSSTLLTISALDISSVSVASMLRSIDDSTSSIKGHFRVSTKSNPQIFSMFAIVGLSTEYDATVTPIPFFTVPISYLSGNAEYWTTGDDLVITFARTGDMGEQGPQGATGEQGIQGPTGAQGEPGPTGPQGEQGIQGPTGVQGEQGIQGATGEQGPTGPTAAVTQSDTPPIEPLEGQLWFNTLNTKLFIWNVDVDSSQWVEVSQTAVGAQGATGATGADGLQGPTGAEGATGPGGLSIISVTAPTGALEGASWFNAETATLYIFYDGYWVEATSADAGPTGATGASNFIGSLSEQPVNAEVGQVYFSLLDHVNYVYTPTGWTSTQGPTGPTGPQGEPGATGPQGADGQSITGPQGIQGPTGAQGPTGEQGPAGADGQSITGPQGATGEQGIQGATGAQGATGEQGPTGADGVFAVSALIPPTGALEGASWFNAETGNLYVYYDGFWVEAASADAGPTGAQGEQGIQGATGAAGPTGPQGADGQSITGPQGATGEQGIQGPTGPQGATGEQGPQGDIGPNGFFAVNSALPPVAPTDGSAWFNAETGNLYVYYDGFWVEAASADAGPTGATGAVGATGPQGTSIHFAGSVPDYSTLLTVTGQVDNDGYIVDADGDLYVWDGFGWVNVGQIVGPQGPQGIQGIQGEHGHTGPQGPAGVVSASYGLILTDGIISIDSTAIPSLVSGVVPDEQLPIDLVRTDGLDTSLESYVPLSYIGATGGVASLDVSGKVPTSQLPASTSGWAYIGSVTSTSGSAVAFSSLGGQYKELLLTFNEVTTSTQNSLNFFRINNDATGSNYSISANRDLGGQTYMGNAISAIYGCVGTMVAFGSYSSGHMRIVNADSTNPKGITLSFKGRYSDWITSNYISDVTEALGGSYNGGSAVTSININLASGTFSGGIWKLWGLQ